MIFNILIRGGAHPNSRTQILEVILCEEKMRKKGEKIKFYRGKPIYRDF